MQKLIILSVLYQFSPFTLYTCTRLVINATLYYSDQTAVNVYQHRFDSNYDWDAKRFFGSSFSLQLLASSQKRLLEVEKPSTISALASSDSHNGKLQFLTVHKFLRQIKWVFPRNIVFGTKQVGNCHGGSSLKKPLGLLMETF